MTRIVYGRALTLVPPTPHPPPTALLLSLSLLLLLLLLRYVANRRLQRTVCCVAVLSFDADIDAESDIPPLP